MKKSKNLGKKDIKSLSSHSSLEEIGRINDASLIEKVKTLFEKPTTVGMLEFMTGFVASTLENPVSLVFPVGRLAQAAAGGQFREQVVREAHRYRDKGKITDENLNSAYGRTILVEMMKIIDDENLDNEKFQALKTIFINSVWEDADEQKQMLAYQCFQICKSLSSIDILILRTAYETYLEPRSSEKIGSMDEWEKYIANSLEIPQEFVTKSRLQNSGASSTPANIIFQNTQRITRHGLTSLGITLGSFLSSPEANPN